MKEENKGGSVLDTNERVKSSLFAFLQSHLKELKEEEIDDIVLAYVVNILEDVASSTRDEEGDAFDVTEFCEMLTAYLPLTESIPAELVTEWMFQLAAEQRELDRAKACKFDFDLSSVIEETARRAPARTPKTSESSETILEKKRSTRYSENSDGGSSDSSGLDASDEFQTKLNNLMEMFPDSCTLEVSHCLNLMAGDIEEAVQLIIHRQENGQSLQPKKATSTIVKPKVDEKDLRNRIVHQYGFVDQEEDARYHRPTIKRGDEKKMIRYRDGKIVSTKGERFSQVTKEESEEMKKSYVS